MENNEKLQGMGPGYNTLFLRLITADLYSACPHRQFHSLPGPKLVSDTQHSTLHVFECGSLNKEYESFHTQESSFKYMELSLEF